MLSYTDPNSNLIIIIMIIIIIVIVLCSSHKTYDTYRNINNYNYNYNHKNKEKFVGKSDCLDSDCDDISLLKIDNNLLLPPVHYMSTNIFNKIIVDLQLLIVDTLQKQARTCSDMNGEDGLEKTHMTFTCINDIENVQTIVINHIAVYIMEYAKRAYNINLNPQLIISDFTKNMDLLENVIYPLLYSRRYTIQGINYFTSEMLINKVVNSLKLKNVLYTTIQRRGIEVLPDFDDHL